MTVSDLVVFLLGAVAGGGGTSMFWIRRSLKGSPNGGDCRHLAWSPWESCEISETWGPNHRRLTEYHPGQKRECLACGYIETQVIVAKRL